MARRRKHPGKPRPIDAAHVESTVEYGGGYFIAPPEEMVRWQKRRKEIAAEVQEKAAGRPILRERRDEGGECLFVAPITGEDDAYYFYDEHQACDRMSKSNPAVHIEPCAQCPDYSGREASS